MRPRLAAIAAAIAGAIGTIGLVIGIAALSIRSHFDRDIALARARIAHGSTLIATRCGPIEYQETGTGVPLLAVHGSGGGYDQGMAFASALAHRGMRVIAERARVNATLDDILPVSARAEGLRSDTAVGKHLTPSQLESVHAPTLIISARDDRYGTYASAQYTAGRIAGARFIGFDEGGHTWVGHDDEVMSEIVKLMVSTVRP